MAAEVWKVFIPHDLLIQPDCFLIGHVSLNNQSVYITASCQDVAEVQSSSSDFLGLWRNNTKFEQNQINSSSSVWIKVWTDLNQTVCCSVFIDRSKVSCTCIIYNPKDLLQSSVLTHGLDSVQTEEDNISSLISVLNSTAVSTDLDQSLVVEYFGSHHEGRSALDNVVWFMLWTIASIYLPFKWLSLRGFSGRNESIWDKLLHIPTTFNQLEARARDLEQVKWNSKLSRFTKLKYINSCCRQLVDSILGIMLMWYLMQDYRTHYIAHVSLSWGETVAGELKTLLNWLMGAPAGLKLNSQLTHFLGNFFLYHVYLWTGYLYLLQPILGYLVFYSSIAGVWGLTVQLALFQDILSTLTIHIYCFYVYAARLYRLQLYCLGSLWRLFRGKKWNVLRQRVDSAIYDADQLFVGTLLFTVLLFLLPTIGLYYVVFTLLRLLVLIGQGIVGKVRSLFNRLPVWSVWLWLVRSKSLTDGAIFEVVSSHQDNLILSMQTSRMSLSNVWSLLQEDEKAHSSPSWGNIVKNLCRGDLVYPWIER